MINIEIIYALEKNQKIIKLNLPDNSAIRDAIKISKICDQYSDLNNQNIDNLEVGIFSQIKSLDTILSDGDRVEVYRPLSIDPMSIRRARAKKQSFQWGLRK